MARKNCYELLDEMYKKAVNELKDKQDKQAIEGSDFFNIDRIHKVKYKTSHGSERIFYVNSDGTLSLRTDEFR